MKEGALSFVPGLRLLCDVYVIEGTLVYAGIRLGNFVTKSLYSSNVTVFYGWVWGIFVIRSLLFFIPLRFFPIIV